MKKFTTFVGAKAALSSCFKELPLNFNFILELYHTSFGDELLLVVKGGQNFSFDNPLDCVWMSRKFDIVL